jgi:tetratricopeptide (TPR) repeat protein
MDVFGGTSSSPRESLERAFELGQRAIALDDSLADGHAALARVYLVRRQHTEAIAAGERAVALNPSHADATMTLAMVLAYSGRPEESIGLVKNAMRLSPVYPPWYLWILSASYRLTGRYEEALAASEKHRDLAPESWLPHALMALAYAGLNREAEARAAMAHALRLDPRMTLERLAKGIPYKNPADLERTLDLYRKAGLK